MKIYIFSLLLVGLLLALADGALAATQVTDNPIDHSYMIFNSPAPNAVYKIGDTINFSGKIRVHSCGNGLFYNRVTLYIAEDKDIPLTTTGPDVYNNCFGAHSSNYPTCVGIPYADKVQVLDITKGFKVYKHTPDIYPPDVTGYHGEGSMNWIEFNSSFVIPSDLGFHGNARFYVEFSGTHWNGDWNWVIAYQKGTIIAEPTAVINCDNSQCGSGSTCDPSMKAYQPTAKPQSCIYTIKNTSTPDDNIKKSVWYVKPEGNPDDDYQQKLACTDPGLPCNYTLQNDLGPGAYTIKLEVTDNDGRVADTTTDIHIATEIQADFKCKYGDATAWTDCTELSGKVMKGEKICVKDTSRPSEGATIDGWVWRQNDTQVGSDSTACFDADTVNKIGLLVADSAGRSDYKEYILNATLAPKWQEESPNGN